MEVEASPEMTLDVCSLRTVCFVVFKSTTCNDRRFQCKIVDVFGMMHHPCGFRVNGNVDAPEKSKGNICMTPLLS